MKNNKENSTQPCPCDSGKPYKNCCQPYLEQGVDAATAEALMRSRYSAFCLQNEAYLRYSWHPETCPKNILLNDDCRWLGLKIKSTLAGNETDETGEVEFVARSKTSGKASRLHENSRFGRFNNRWVYIDGNINNKFVE